MAKLTPQRRAELEAEREFLLRSLADLDAERADGGIDPENYATLHSDYTARAAAVLRALAGGDDQRPKPPPIPAGRRLAVVAAIVVFAGGAVFALAQSAGTREPGGSLTGGVTKVTFDPKSYEGHMARAAELRNAGVFPEATKEYVAAAQLRPNSGEARTALAEMLISVHTRGQSSDPQILEAAADSARLATVAEPKLAQAWLYRGLALELLDHPRAEWAPFFERYLELAPDGPQAPMARSMLARTGVTTTTGAPGPASTTP